MSNGNPVSRARFPDTAPDKQPAEKLTAGVPLTKLIQRELSDRAEIVMISRTRSLAAEKFRRLKTMLVNEKGGGPQVIVITSSSPAEGKSLISMNLALAFAADRDDKVLLLDADLRRPTVETFVSPPPKLGLTEVLEGRTELEHALLQLKNSSLKILPAGTPPRDPVVLLASEAAKTLLASLRRNFDRIIIDTPPVSPFADADAIGALADGLLMVARAGKTRRGLLEQSLQSVTSTRILGTVLNDATFSFADRENYAAYDKTYYDYYNKDREKS